MTVEAHSIHAATTVAACVAVVAGTAWQSTRVRAVLWAGAALAVYLAAAAFRHVQWGSGSWVDAALVFGVVPAGIVVLARQSHDLTQRLSGALKTSEVARAKLVRSTRELQASMAKTEEALGKLETIVENLAEGLVAASREGRVEIANPALARLLEVGEVPTGARLEDALPAPMRALVAACLQGEDVVIEEVRLPAGRIVLAVASPIRLQGTLWGTVMLVRDVTLQKEIDRMKSDFAATVSHEMRTPLTSVLGFTRVIENQLDKWIFPLVPEGDARARRAESQIRGNLAIVVEEAQRLTALINDVLDISKMESGQMTWDLQPQAPAALVQRAVDVTGSLFEARPELVRVVELEPDLPAVSADRDRVLQVLINLVGNAVKFTPSGRITVSARRSAPEGVVFAVRDTGVGIRAVHHDAVFEKFKQVGDVLTDRPKGTGLGLPICREIVTHHGGRIWVESEPGEGSCFAFVLPLADPEAS